MNPHGVRLKEPERSNLAREAFRLREKGMSPESVANELDVSTPTARNLILYGRRLHIHNERERGQ